MTCYHCHTLNADDEHRCRHCGRRLADSRLNSVAGNLAAAPLPAHSYTPAQPAPNPLPAAAPGVLAAATAGQQLLLNLQRSQSKVIPFDSLPGSGGGGPRSVAGRPAAGPARSSRRTAPVSMASAGQQKLDFLPPAPKGARKLPTSVEAVIHCDAQVAIPMHRAVAAALDFAMVLIAFGFFLLVFHLAGGEFAPDRGNLAVFGAALWILAMFYGLLWVLAGADSPGKRWTQLRLITFDGYPPELSQRLSRYLAACLGLAAVGAGVLWALADEESLSWHDHISETFPTVRETESNFFRQR